MQSYTALSLSRRLVRDGETLLSLMMVKSHLLHNGALAKSPRLFFYFFDLHSIIKRPTPFPLDLKRRSCVIYDRPHRCDSDATRSDHKYLPLLGVETNNTTELAICIYRETTFGYFSSTIVTLNRGRLGFCVSSQLILYIGFLLDYKSSRRFFFRAQIKPAEREREWRKEGKGKERNEGKRVDVWGPLRSFPSIRSAAPLSHERKGEKSKGWERGGWKRAKRVRVAFKLSSGLIGVACVVFSLPSLSLYLSSLVSKSEGLIDRRRCRLTVSPPPPPI